MPDPLETKVPGNARQPGLWWVCVLTPLTIATLGGVLFYAWKAYPRVRPFSMDFGRAEAQAQQAPPSWWQRLLANDRVDPREKKPPRDQWTRFWEQATAPQRRVHATKGRPRQTRSRDDDQVSAQVSPGGSGAIAEVANEDHLALRQLVIAEAIIRFRDSVNPGGLERIQKSAPNGPWRQLEEDRYEMERIWLLYQAERATAADFERLATVTSRMLESKYASFEDYANAGFGAALAGNSADAMRWLSRALATWPALRDSMRGQIYLFLTCMAAIEGHDAVFIHMLNDFQDNYPDWLYVETYLPHLEQLTRTYPDHAAHMAIVRGHAMALVYNHRAARELYDQALDSGTLSPELRTRVVSWRRTLIPPPVPEAPTP